MSDKNLWNNLRAGDKNALESIYSRYLNDLYNYGKRFTDDSATVEDCIQELFVELWQRREKLSETSSIKPYLLVSLKRKIIHTIKRVRKSTDVEIKETHFEAELSIEHLIEKREWDLEKTTALKNAFEQLSDRQKEILYLKYFADVDYDEIVIIMDMNYQSARNLASRALLKLSKLMQILTILLSFSG